MAETFIGDGNRVGLLTYGMTYLDWIFPGYGKVQREKIMRSLASATPADNQVFRSLENLPVRFFSPQTQLIMISTLPKGDHNHIIGLRAIGHSVLMVSPDPVSYVTADGNSSDTVRAMAARLARVERNLMLGRMRQARIHVLDWDVRIPLERAVHISFNQILPEARPARLNL